MALKMKIRTTLYGILSLAMAAPPALQAQNPPAAPAAAAAPAPAELWPAWRPWVAGRPLVAHNVGTERKFLRRAAPLHEFGPWIDTLKLARRVRPDLAGHALADVCRALGLAPRLRELCPGRDWHDALFDAFASALVLEHCLALPGWEDVGLDALAGLR